MGKNARFLRSRNIWAHTYNTVSICHLPLKFVELPDQLVIFNQLCFQLSWAKSRYELKTIIVISIRKNQPEV